MQPSRAFSIVLLSVLAARARAQGVVHTVLGTPDTSFGSAVRHAGDLDFDGVDDLAVGMPRATSSMAPFIGRACVLSGASLRSGSVPCVIRRWEGDLGQGVRFGASIGTGGDVDGDKVPDVAIGAPGDDHAFQAMDCGSVRVCSGLTGATLHTFYAGGHKGLGGAVAIVGDVNGNGFQCVSGSALYRFPAGSSSASGSLVHAPDLAAPPIPSGAILPGSTWCFQAWYRDPAAGGASFNLSNGLSIAFTP